ncbi:MAG: rRNA maturation RNase YbeY [Polyangiaceae bacterium]
MTVLLQIERGPHEGVERREIRRRARAMLAALQLENLELSIVLTDDDQIQILNRDYRGKDKPTDVLAFSMREGEFSSLSGDVLGDVILSIPTARRQALRARRSVLDEVTMLLAHGILHLLGWDHDTKAKDVAMRRETARLEAAAAPAVPSVKERKGKATAAKVGRTSARKRVTASASANGPATGPKKTTKPAPTASKGRARRS